MIHYKTETVFGFWPLALGLPLFPLLDSVEDQRPKTKGQKAQPYRTLALVQN
jgi:hypothetical protein